MTIDFTKLDEAETRLVHEIAKRAAEQHFTIGRSLLDWHMDVHATHSICPLKLEELSKAPTGDFDHDLVGIYQHLDRDSGEMSDCFVPRLAKPEPVKDTSLDLDIPLRERSKICKCGAAMMWRDYCACYVCCSCEDHHKMARCFCGWAISGGDGRAELVEMGEVIGDEI